MVRSESGPGTRLDPAELWQQALRHLSQHVSQANYDTWLDGTEGMRFLDHSLVIGTKSEFVTEWMQKRMRPLIVRTLTELAEAGGLVAWTERELRAR